LAGGNYGIGVQGDRFCSPDDLGERHEPDVGWVEAHHGSERSIGQRTNRGGAEPKAEQAI
jgi:hypothetical protein